MNKVIIRKYLVLSFYIVLISIIQFNFFGYMKNWGITPNLFIVLTVLIAFLYGVSDGIIVGITAGLIMDMYAGRYIGFGILICLYLGIISSFFLKKYFSKSIYLGLIQILFATILYHVVFYGLSIIVYSTAGTLAEFTVWVARNRLFPSLIGNAIAFIIIYLMLQLISPYNRKISIPDEEPQNEVFLWL